MRDRAARGITLVLDENLSGRRILKGLRDEGIAVVPQTAFMKRGVSDEELLRKLAGKPDHFLLSKDSDFHRRPAVKAALFQHGIGAFIITAHKNKTAADLVSLIVRAWPRMQRCAENHRRPFVAKILADARVEVIVEKHA